MASAVVETSKRPFPVSETLECVKAVVLDTEGTTAPLEFLRETLVTYVKENVRSYLTDHWTEEECQANVSLLQAQATEDIKNQVEGAIEIPNGEKEDMLTACVQSVLWQLETQRNSQALTDLQNHVCFKMGHLKAEHFDDVVPAMTNLQTQGKKLYMYSNGAAEDEKVMLAYSNRGNLLKHVTGYFDTEIGIKAESETYTKIASEIGCQPGETLYVTDMPSEAVAAVKAGLKAAVVARNGQPEMTDDEKESVMVVSSLTELCTSTADGEPPAKKAAEPNGTVHIDQATTDPTAAEDGNRNEQADKPDVEQEPNGVVHIDQATDNGTTDANHEAQQTAEVEVGEEPDEEADVEQATEASAEDSPLK